jgi:plastocyanin
MSVSKAWWSRRSFLRSIGGLSLAGLAGLLSSCQHEKTNLAKKPVIAVGGAKGELIFVPDRLRIAVGATVTWVLQSGGHTVTAYHPLNHTSYPARIPEDAPPWDTDLLIQKGTLFTGQFPIEGVYNYFCRPHESVGMVGAIVVGQALDGPGLAPPQEVLPPLARHRLAELLDWAKKLR